MWLHQSKDILYKHSIVNIKKKANNTEKQYCFSVLLAFFFILLRKYLFYFSSFYYKHALKNQYNISCTLIQFYYFIRCYLQWA
jgi:hypothetical protein